MMCNFITVNKVKFRPQPYVLPWVICIISLIIPAVMADPIIEPPHYQLFLWLVVLFSAVFLIFLVIIGVLEKMYTPPEPTLLRRWETSAEVNIEEIPSRNNSGIILNLPPYTESAMPNASLIHGPPTYPSDRP